MASDLDEFARSYATAWCSQNSDSVASFFAEDGSLSVNDGRCTNKWQKLGTDAFTGVSDCNQLGGTRHQSAAQFVFDQKDAIAIVASQDGRLSVLGWDRTGGKVIVIRPAEFALL
jgi:DNA integrity scanning protein DisA with diadenylate cyclase activity